MKHLEDSNAAMKLAEAGGGTDTEGGGKTEDTDKEVEEKDLDEENKV